MATARESIEAGAATRRKVFIVVGVVTALLVALMVYWALRPHPRNDRDVQPHLAGALRPPAPEFEQLRQKIVVDFVPDEDATESTRPLGDIVMEMRPKVRNFTGRTAQYTISATSSAVTTPTTMKTFRRVASPASMLSLAVAIILKSRV